MCVRRSVPSCRNAPSPAMAPLSIGVTAADSGIGQAVLDSLRDRDLDVRTIGFEASPWAKGLYECDSACRVPYAHAEDYVPTLLDLSYREGLCALIPGVNDAQRRRPTCYRTATSLRPDCNRRGPFLGTLHSGRLHKGYFRAQSGR